MSFELVLRHVVLRKRGAKPVQFFRTSSSGDDIGALGDEISALADGPHHLP